MKFKKINSISKGFEENYLIFFLFSLIYAFSIKSVLSDFAAPEWPIFSFPYDPPSLFGYIFVILSIGFTSFVVPKILDSPSSLMLSFVYIFIIIPINVACICMEKFSTQSYYYITAFIVFCFVILCACNSIARSRSHLESEPRLETPIFEWMLYFGFAILSAYLIYRYGEIMELVGLDSLYEQRAEGKASNLFDGYAQTYSQYVFSTGLVAFGLYRKRKILVLAGMMGAVLNYSITAEKAGIMFPFFICGLYFMISSPRKILHSTLIFLIIFSIVNILSSKLFASSSFFEILAINFGTRSTVVPGVFSFHYLEFFSARGFTEFSHIRGINIFVPPPDSFAGDGRWPGLGLILGEDYIGYPELNANANFVASDGIAGYGLPGVIVPFVTLFGIVRVLDYVTRGVPLKLCLPLLTPFALTLSNSSVFSVLTSFGGFFWMVVFSTMFVAKTIYAKQSTPQYVGRFG